MAAYRALRHSRRCDCYLPPSYHLRGGRAREYPRMMLSPPATTTAARYSRPQRLEETPGGTALMASLGRARFLDNPTPIGQRPVQRYLGLRARRLGEGVLKLGRYSRLRARLQRAPRQMAPAYNLQRLPRYRAATQMGTGYLQHNPLLLWAARQINKVLQLRSLQQFKTLHPGLEG